MKYDVDVAVKITHANGEVEYENLVGVYDGNSKLLAAHKCFQQFRRAYRSFDKTSELVMIEYTADIIEPKDDDDDDDEYEPEDDVIDRLPRSNLFARLCYDIFRVGKLYFTMLGISTAAAMLVYCIRYTNAGEYVGMEQYIYLTGSIIAFALSMIAGYGIIDHILLGAYRRIRAGSSCALASTISKIFTTLVAIPSFYGVLYVCINIVFFGINNHL